MKYRNRVPCPIILDYLPGNNLLHCIWLVGRNYILLMEKGGLPVRRLILVVLSLWLLGWSMSGCIPVTINSDTVGPYPDNYREIIKAHVLHTFFDPYSIRSASITGVGRGHLYFQPGWVVCLQCNAKNRLGGYVGIKKTAYLIYKGAVIDLFSLAGV